MNRLTLAVASMAMVAGMAASQDAFAIERLNLTNGAGSCQGALPNFEGNLRKRPTAIANEGTANAFVSCSITQDFLGNPATYGLLLNNNGSAAANVSCTLAAGIKINGQQAPTLIPKTFSVPAGSFAEVQWSSEDNGDVALPRSGNWSCNIPVGVEIGATYIVVEDGSAPPAP